MSDQAPRSQKKRSGGASQLRAEGLPGASRILQALVEELERLPGVGKRTAERLAYFILRSPNEDALRLAHAIREVKQSLRHCRHCFHVTEAEVCSVCSDPARDPSTLCVVEEPKDVYSIEATGSYRGHYHVLLGAFSPLDGVGPEDLTIEALLGRLRTGSVREVILATNPNFEGDGTALLLREKLREFSGLRVTRLARGLPSGSNLEHVSRTIVQDALEGRREMSS